MVPQQAQRLRWEDDVDIFLWCDKGRVFDDDELILSYLFLAQLWRTHTSHPSLPFFIIPPVHLLLLFTLPMPDDFSLMDSTFAFFACWRG